MTGTDWVTVIPARGETVATARELLALAEDPAHVRTARGGAEFLVAPYVADAFNTPKRPRKRPAKKETDS